MNSDNGYKDLAGAVIMQAIDDWRLLCNAMTNPKGRKYPPAQSFDALRRFFKSDWCETICIASTPEKILEKLEQELREARKKEAI